MSWLFLTLFLVFLLLITFSFFIVGIITKNKKYIKLPLLFWCIILVLYLIALGMHHLNAKIVLEKEDFYGTYTIDRNYFPGEQANWQYNHFRFEIKENDSIYFNVTEGLDIIKTYKGKIYTRAPFKSARPVIRMEEPTHHILTTNPTIYRKSWNFMMVFKSPKFHNMYFRKGEWEEID